MKEQANKQFNEITNKQTQSEELFTNDLKNCETVHFKTNEWLTNNIELKNQL